MATIILNQFLTIGIVMLKRGTEQSIVGDGNSQNFIENAVFNPPLKSASNKSFMHSLLVSAFKMLDNEDSSSSTYDLAVPNEVEKKFSYNGVLKYREILNLASVDSFKLEAVMSDFSRSEKLVNAVARIYQNIAIQMAFRPTAAEESETGATEADRLLVEVTRQILERLQADPDDVVRNYNIEEVEEFVVALVYYCLERCKVLERVPEE